MDDAGRTNPTLGLRRLDTKRQFIPLRTVFGQGSAYYDLPGTGGRDTADDRAGHSGLRETRGRALDGRGIDGRKQPTGRLRVVEELYDPRVEPVGDLDMGAEIRLVGPPTAWRVSLN